MHLRGKLRVAVAVAGPALVGCRARSHVPESGAESAPAPAPASAPALPPILGELESLPIPGHPPAALSLPTGATTRRPVAIVIHGSGDRPNWQCEGWRIATSARAFVICPTGAVDPHWSTPADTRYTHSGGPELLAHIDASLAALTARYPDHADTTTPLLAGFSLGAAEILALAAQDPARFPRIALIEGAWASWTPDRIASFKHGGLRILYGAGQRDVERKDQLAAARLRAADLDTHVVFAPVGHSFDPPLSKAIASELPWLMEADPRWLPPAQ
jgi:predicted esterase